MKSRPPIAKPPRAPRPLSTLDARLWTFHPHPPIATAQLIKPPPTSQSFSPKPNNPPSAHCPLPTAYSPLSTLDPRLSTLDSPPPSFAPPYCHDDNLPLALWQLPSWQSHFTSPGLANASRATTPTTMTCGPTGAAANGRNFAKIKTTFFPQNCAAPIFISIPFPTTRCKRKSRSLFGFSPLLLNTRRRSSYQPQLLAAGRVFGHSPRRNPFLNEGRALPNFSSAYKESRFVPPIRAALR